jgi:hypothetical protein
MVLPLDMVSLLYLFLIVYIAWTLLYAIYLVYDIMWHMTTEHMRKELCYTL